MKTWNELKYTKQRIVSHKQIAKGSYMLSFRRNFDFKAGQVVGLGINKEIAPRLYSIASAEKADMIDILYAEKAGGKLSPALPLFRTGDEVLVSEPFGTFTQVSDEAVYIAAGTGIAPFMSRILSEQGNSPTLIHGVSYPEYFYYSDYLTEKLGRNYIQCCSRCPADDYFQGRVTNYIKQWKNIDTTKKYYLCGSAEMVVDTRDVLISRGVPFANINAEIYF